MTKKVNKLSDLEIDEVSLVDRGANQHASVEFYKNLEGTPADEDVEKNSPDQSAVHVDESLEEDKEDEEEKVEKSFFSKLISKVFNAELATRNEDDGTMHTVGKMNPGLQMPYQQQMMGQPAPGPQNMMPAGPQAFPADAAMGEAPADIQAGPPLPDEVIDYIQQLEEALAQAQGQEGGELPEEDDVSDIGKQHTDMDEADFLAELAKSLHDEDQREQITKAERLVKQANELAEEAERIAKAERDHRLNQEFVSKARALTNLPVSATEFGPVLKKLHDVLSEEEVALVEKALSAANETTAQYFEEIGKRGDNVLINGRLDDVAKSLVEKNSDMTMEQARAKALEADPSLYDEYLNDRSA